MKKGLVGVLILALTCCMVGCNVQKNDVTVCVPDGAPALALAKAMAKDKDNDGVTYKVVAGKTIQTYVTYNDLSKNADVCVLPVTAGAKLLGDGTKYQMLGVVTQGNLFLFSTTEKVEYTAENLSALKGKTVKIAQLNEVPGWTFKSILEKHGVAYQVLQDGIGVSTEKVNLSSSVGAIEVVAEPTVSKKLANGGYLIGDLQRLYSGSENGGYPQAIVVAKKEFILENKAWIKNFVEQVRGGEEWLSTASASVIYDTVYNHLDDRSMDRAFSVDSLSKATIKRCGIAFEETKNCKIKVEEYLQGLVDIGFKGASQPSESFYWQNV